MLCTYQTDADLVSHETFRCLQVLEVVFVNVDGSLKRILEALSMMVNQLSPEEVFLNRLAENYKKLFTNYRKTCENTSQILRNVLNEMTTPSSLLEMTLTAVSNYNLPTNELPKELELQLQEVEETTSTLGDSINYLKFEIRHWFPKVLLSVLNIERVFDRILDLSGSYFEFLSFLYSDFVKCIKNL